MADIEKDWEKWKEENCFNYDMSDERIKDVWMAGYNSYPVEAIVRQGDPQPVLLAKETKGMDLEARAEIIVDDDLRYGDDDKAIYWELHTETSREIEAEKCLEMLADNWKVGTKLFVFVPEHEDSKQSA